jgi:hypothetical protein
MGSGLTKPAPSECVNEQNIKALKESSADISSKNEKAVDMFINRMMSNGNQKEMIASILLNEESRRYFIDFLRVEFEKDKLVLNSWKV